MAQPERHEDGAMTPGLQHPGLLATIGLLEPPGHIADTDLRSPYDERFMHELTDARYEQSESLGHMKGLLKAFGHATGFDMSQPGLLIVREKPVTTIGEEELEAYPPLSYDINHVYPGEADEYGTVVALQYLLPDNRNATMQATPMTYVALRMKLGFQDHVSVASEAFNRRQVNFVAETATALYVKSQRGGNVFKLNDELVLDQPFRTDEGYWLI